ncbi:MAG: Holliday junction resolvase RuvX [Candidatus Marinimicrobia bacterium]|nr:Holliday junction resolvase RuvX [Candidatus Neomarinimicrobiota bacterium]
MGRILGIDYGDRRVGIALSDPLKMIASPKETLLIQSDEDLLNQLKHIIVEYDVEAIVIGLPIGMKGNETKQTIHVKTFSLKLSQFDLPVFLEDERLSSVSAKKSLHLQNIKTGHEKGQVDKVAASILLQQYLDKNY